MVTQKKNGEKQRGHFLDNLESEKKKNSFSIKNSPTCLVYKSFCCAVKKKYKIISLSISIDIDIYIYMDLVHREPHFGAAM